jgi:hypothetical protein
MLYIESWMGTSPVARVGGGPSGRQGALRVDAEIEAPRTAALVNRTRLKSRP